MIGFLLWLYPTIGAIIGVYICRFSIITYRYYGYALKEPSTEEAGKLLLGIIVGILAGVLMDIITLGPMVILINVQNYLDDIRNKLYSVEINPVENIADKESKGAT